MATSLSATSPLSTPSTTLNNASTLEQPSVTTSWYPLVLANVTTIYTPPASCLATTTLLSNTLYLGYNERLGGDKKCLPKWDGFSSYTRLAWTSTVTADATAASESVEVVHTATTEVLLGDSTIANEASITELSDWWPPAAPVTTLNPGRLYYEARLWMISPGLCPQGYAYVTASA
jgi:hypothetical protein